MIIGDAHDQPALTLHQVLHWFAPLVSSVNIRHRVGAERCPMTGSDG